MAIARLAEDSPERAAYEKRLADYVAELDAKESLRSEP
jgi:hypothetical protein